MRVDIHDRNALLAVSPSALSAYARATGWHQHSTYRNSSDVYIAEELPEIIIPRVRQLGDYASVVSELITIFADVTGRDEMNIYRCLVTADRDVIRLRAGDSHDGSVTLSHGVHLIEGAYKMLLAAACSLDGEPKPVYRAGANRGATELLSKIHLGQTEHGSFVTTLVTPVLPPPIPSLYPDDPDHDQPPARQLTIRLMEVLAAVRHIIEQTTSGNTIALVEMVKHGVSANLCEALEGIVSSIPTLDVSVSWAQTYPMTETWPPVLFSTTDAPLLNETGRTFRRHAPHYDVRLQGFVRLLKREEGKEEGLIHLKTIVDDKEQSVITLLERHDYERVVEAHKDQSAVILSGDLERMNQRWRLLNPQLKGILTRDDSAPKSRS